MAVNHITLQHLRDTLTGRLQNTGFWSPSELDSCVKEALRLWQLFTGYWRGTKTIKLVQNVTYYSTCINPDPLLKPFRVTLASTPLDLDSVWSMDNGRPGWQGDAMGLPKRWFPLGISQIGLHPRPSSTYHLTEITVEGLKRTPTLVAATDTVDLAQWLEDIIMDEGQHIASFKQGGAEFGATLALHKGFLEACGRQNEKFKLSSLYRQALGLDRHAQQQPRFSQVVGGKEK